MTGIRFGAVVFVLGLAACAPQQKVAAAPEPASIARNIVVEVVDTTSGQTKISFVPIAIVEDRGPSAIELKSPDEELKVEASADRSGTSSIVKVKVYRWRTTPTHNESYQLATSVRTLWQRGSRMHLGKSTSHDHATEVAFTMQ